MARVVAVLAGGGLLTLLAAWASAPASTTEAVRRAGPLRRAARWYRALWIRWLLWWASWPHIVDVLVGAHRAPVEPTPSEEVWREASVTLRRYAGPRTRGVPLLVVHALVTRPWILDLAPGASFVGALVAAGFDVFLLDWGDAERTDADRGIARCVDLLMQAEKEVLRTSGARRLHMVGYCSGATLCLIRLGGWEHGNIASLAAIAPPVDLAVPGGMRTMLAHRLLRPVWALDGDGCVPAAVVRESFHALRPEAIKAVRRAFRRRRDPAFRSVYDPLSRWAYEQRRIPGALFFDTVELYRTNALYEGQLTIDGRPVGLDRVRIPLLLGLALRDHIVPGASSQALGRLVRLETVDVPSGHVSMLSGDGGRKHLWPALVDFLERHSTAGKGARRSARAGRRTTAT